MAKMIDPKSPAARLLAARRKHGLTQVDLAVLMTRPGPGDATYDRGQVSSVETGRQRGGREFWEAAARVFNVGIDHFLMGTELPPENVAERQQGISDAPMPDNALKLAEFGETAARVEALLREERMGTDTRTIAENTALVWRSIQLRSGLLPFADRLELALSERRSVLARSRATMMQIPTDNRRAG